LKNEINRRLNRATTISLVVDIWTNCIMVHPADDISSIQKTQIQTFDTVETELDELIIELNRKPYNKNLSSCSYRINHKDLSV